MNEMVLAVPRLAIESLLRQGFFEAHGTDLIGRLGEQSVFIDRQLAEEDPSYKQIIPYVLVEHDGKFLVYRRTAKQGENRLHGRLSIGFGGHINEVDGKRDTRTNVILAAMVRELNEEVYLPNISAIRVAGFINDESNPVGRVHLGVVFVVETGSDRVVVNEPEMIEAYWRDARAIEEDYPRFEPWSRILWSEHVRPHLVSGIYDVKN